MAKSPHLLASADVLSSDASSERMRRRGVRHPSARIRCVGTLAPTARRALLKKPNAGVISLIRSQSPFGRALLVVDSPAEGGEMNRCLLCDVTRFPSLRRYVRCYPFMVRIASTFHSQQARQSGSQDVTQRVATSEEGIWCCPTMMCRVLGPALFAASQQPWAIRLQEAPGWPSWLLQSTYSA